MDKIIATNDTIHQIVRSEIRRLGSSADLNHIDTSNVTDMSFVFYEDPNEREKPEATRKFPEFNGDISKWDVSNVKKMTWMFRGSQFNGDISNWNVSNVKYMWEIFAFSKFNGDISKWDVKNVKDMEGMSLNAAFYQKAYRIWKGNPSNKKKQQINTSSNIDKPAHYANDDIECIDVILQNSKNLPGDQAALCANIQKYIWRYNAKGNPLEDLQKAQWYLNKLIDLVTRSK